MRPTKEMKTTYVIGGREIIRREAKINSKFNTISVNLQEPMRA